MAAAFEATGFAGFSLPSFHPKDPAATSSAGGVGYGFSLREELGPGSLEGGFLFQPAVIRFIVGSNEVQARGSYWILPLLYRVSLFSPFFSFAAGPDFAIRGGTSYTVEEAALASAPASGYRSHFGLQASLQAVQDIGQDLSAVLDLRYRHGLAPAISVQSTASAIDTLMISLGIQKRLE